MSTFDRTRKRDPVDRAVVDEIRLYAEELRGTVLEFEWENRNAPSTANFVFGWEGDHVSFFQCVGENWEPESIKSSIVPPDTLRGLRHLREIWTRGYTADLSWLGTLEGLQKIEIDMPDDEKKFPASWDCASTLQSIALRFLGITSIRFVPDSIRGLQETRRIIIMSGVEQSVDLPDWLGSFPHLERLALYGGFISIPHSVVETGLPFIEDRYVERGIIVRGVTLEKGDVGMYLSNDRDLLKAFYSGEQVAAGEAIRECKVIFLGDGGAGKSSLIERMMYDRFELGKLPTDGMRVIPWDTELDGRPFRLRFLDFGGQEIMHAMHRCFLSDHTVYVVVCSSRDTTEINSVVIRWLEQVRSYAPGCPVILALNKADEIPGISVDETTLRERYPSLRKVLKTSAKDGPASEFFAGRLYDAIMDEVPACVQNLQGNKGMLAVKRTLEDMRTKEKRPYITSEQYQDLCVKNGVEGKKLQRSMLEWFRDLGVAYFYEREAWDRSLESLRVLDPVWLTNGIYRLILRTEKKVKNGILSHDDIRETLATPYKGDAEEDLVYNAEETEFVLHVMRMFQISHEMEDGLELIPMLMQVDKPRSATRIPRADALHLRWKGTFLPNNLIHRLTIQKFPELDRSCMWSRGARSKSGDCTAQAQMDDDKSLDLYIWGGDAAGRRIYLDNFRQRIGTILKELNLWDTTEEQICCIINDKEGELPYKTVLFAYQNGDEKILLQDILEYASPEKILRMVDDPKKWSRWTPRPDPDPPSPKDDAETWNLNLQNVLLVFLIVVALVLIATGTPLRDLIPFLNG